MLTIAEENIPFVINTGLDLDRLQAEFKQSGRVCIPQFLNEDAAQALRKHLAENVAWSIVLCVGGNVKQGPPDWRLDYPSDEDALIKSAYESARTRFAFVYENSGYVPECFHERQPGSTFLDRYSTFINSAEFLDLIQNITGIGSIAAGDIQATRYRPGHFRMFNNDRGNHRRVVASLCLTPDWAAPWGGLLQFRGFTGHVDAVHMPRFNSMSIFGIEHSHAVSLVSPFAQQARYAVTAWMRRAASTVGF